MLAIIVLLFLKIQFTMSQEDIINAAKGNCTSEKGVWKNWNEWSLCSSSCGNDGIRSRKRVCISSTSPASSCLIEVDLEKENCSRHKCPVKIDYYTKLWPCFFYPPVHGIWSEWITEYNCSSHCQGTIGYMSRDCTSPKPKHCGKYCGKDDLKLKLCPINGSWGEWSVYTTCSVTCQLGGIQTRTRACNSPTPQYNGRNCEGVTTETLTGCNGNVGCPVHGMWGHWSVYTACSITCGVGGSITRTRACNNPTPRYNGNNCIGNAAETQNCNGNAICRSNYYFSSISDTWNNAKVLCENMGMMLTTIDSAVENTQIANELQRLGISYAFIGYRKLLGETWKWISGSPKLYENWLSTGNLDSTMDNCAGIDDGNGKWQSSLACNGRSNTHYICEII